MNTQQVEKETGVTRQNIRYYEKAGLLHPERDKGNAYRIYSEEDVEALKIIKMLRMLDMPLEDIRRVLEREETITEAVARQRELLLARQRQLKAAVDMCDRIRKEGDEKFNVDACLNQMEEMERQGSVFARIVEGYRKVARMEEKREICFYIERKAEHPKDIIKAGVALIAKEAGQETDYNTMYSQSSLSAGLEEAQGETDQEETDVNLPLCGVIPAAVAVAVVSVAVIGGFAYRNLRREPLVLLEQYEE